MDAVTVARTEDMQQIARALLNEAGHYAKPNRIDNHHWKGEPPSEAQLKLIRMRRGGPNMEYRLPEALYKAVVHVVTGGWSYRDVKTALQASQILDAFNHLDPVHLERIEGIIKAIELQAGLFGEVGEANEK